MPRTASWGSSPFGQDMAPQGSVEAFLGERDIGRFAAYHDADMELSSALSVQVFRRPSYTTRKATRCGAMSATSTGLARRPLSCLPS